MADDGKRGYVRLNHFHGLRLESTDFQVGEQYHVDMKRLHNKVFHGHGIVSGYAPAGSRGGLSVVARRRGDTSVEVHPGYAIDAEGHDILLWDPEIKTIDPSKFRLPQDVFVVLKFVDEPTEFIVNAANPKYKGHRRVLETSKVEVVANEPDPEEAVELARIHLTDSVTEIRDAVDPSDPQAGEIDTRFVQRTGISAVTLDPQLLFRFQQQLGIMRDEFSMLATKFKLQTARELRACVSMLQMLAVGNLVRSIEEATKMLRMIAEYEQDMLSEFQSLYPEMVDTREYMDMKENVQGLLHLTRAPKFTEDEFNSILSYEMKALESASGLGEMEVREPEPEPEPESVAAAVVAAAPEPEPEPVSKALPGSKELTWDELQELSGELPDLIFLEDHNYRKVDEIKMLDKANEKEHDFKMEAYKDQWSTNQSYQYPDGTKISSKGRAHVGGYSEWDFLNVETGRDLIIAKRVDYAFSGLTTAIFADGKKVDDWKIEGQDRKFRWRNWLFRIPGDFVSRDRVTVKQECVDAEREVNMFKLWCYQAID